MQIRCLLLSLAVTVHSFADSVADRSGTATTRLITDHCLACHSPDAGEAGIVLTSARLSSEHDPAARVELLQKIQRVLEDQEMPPPGEDPVPADVRAAAIAEIQQTRGRLLIRLPFRPTPVRRMNRFEYNNAVVDLLQLQRDIFQLNERLMRRRENYFDPASGNMPNRVRVSCRPLSKDIDSERPEGFRGVAAFPQDQRAEHGFDNRGDHLTLSPLLMESFLNLSESIAFSDDLNERECGCWNRLFAPPETTDPSPDSPDWIHRRTEWLLRKAFRQTVDRETVKDFANVARQELAAGASVEQSMRRLLATVLAMPRFLYFREAPAQQSVALPGREPVSDFELATRLARFLWSSIPDDRLLQKVEAGTLRQPDVLKAEIDRMLNDRRMARFCDNFPGQWLQLDRLVTAVPDPQKFPWFYYNGYRTSMHMMSEPLLLFETVFVEDRSIMELIDSDYTWESDMLAANYEGRSDGRRDVKVQTFHRVSADDARRGGVITTAAVMTMTSTPVRTQPITRGAWMNSVIFNDPPEPPPADVPPLPEQDSDALSKLTIREQLALHRERADCAGCHNRIDPLGFALENFGPTGVWRDRYENQREVEVSGRLFGRYSFASIAEFKSILLQQRERFVRGFTAHLLSYALGRSLGPADEATLNKIVEQTGSGNDSLRTVLKHVATSESFLCKNNPAPPLSSTASQPEHGKVKP